MRGSSARPGNNGGGVGRVPNGVQPMETEFAGGPVDGGTIPR